MRDPQSPLEYLVTSSQTSLEAFELTRLNRAANLRKELRDVLDEWMHAEIDARMARWILECRRAQNGDSDSLPAPPPEPARIRQLAMSFLPEPSDIRSKSIAPQPSNDAGKGTDENRALGCRSRPPQCPQPMNSKDAAASLRLLEQFLARPAPSVENLAEIRKCGFGNAAVAAVAANGSGGSSRAPHRNRPAGSRSACERSASAHRRKLHAMPATRFLLAARHNQ